MLPAHYNKDKPSYFCRFTFGQFFTLLVLEIFTLFFIFYLGARYGRTLLGIETPPTLAEQKGLPEVKATDPNVVATTNDPEIQKLTRDILESAPAPDLKKRVAEILREEKKSPEPHKTITQKEPVTPPPVFGQKARSAGETGGGVIQTAPQNAKFTIQIGSYPNPGEAHGVVSRWKQKGYPAYLVSADIPGKGRWYRVRLGGFNTKADAQVYLNDLKGREKVEAFIAPNR